MFKDSIKKRVMKVVSARIDAAQKAHDEEVKQLQAKAEAEQEAIKLKLQEDTELSAEKHVKSVIGNL